MPRKLRALNAHGMRPASLAKMPEIIPADLITSPHADCWLCIWVALRPGTMYLKYVNRACPDHGKVATVR